MTPRPHRWWLLVPLLGCGALNPNGHLDAGNGGSGTSPPVQVSVGQSHVCTALADGSAWCWGRALGTGAPDGGRAIRRVPGLSAREVHAAEEFSCARTDTDAVRCWGTDSFAQLGDNSTATATDPVVPAVPVAVGGLSSFANHTCAVSGAGEAYCWGLSASGESGVTSTTVRTPALVAGVAAVASLRAGSRGTWAVLNDGGVLVWGYDLLGNLGGPPRPFPLSGKARAISANLFHACSVLEDGAVECWGRVNEGAFGVDAGGALWGQGRVPGLSQVSSVCAGRGYSCVSFLSGGVSCWGDNTWGQLGTGNYAPSVVPVAVDGLPAASSVACGDKVTCAVTSDGLYCWGDNQEQQLGSPTPPSTTRPLRVPMP